MTGVPNRCTEAADGATFYGRSYWRRLGDLGRSASSMQFPKTHTEYALAAVSDPESDARLSFREFVDACMQRDPSRNIENRRRKCPDWPDEWLEGHARFRFVSDNNGWLIRGVARRIAFGDVQELQLFLEMHVRTRLFSYCNNHDEYLEVWPLIEAIAIDDEDTVVKHLELGTFPLVTSRGGETARLYNAIHQLLLDPADLQSRDLDLRATKSVASWLRGCLDLVDAFAKDDAAKAQAAYDTILAGFRKSPQINLMEKTIAFCAHALVRLGQRVAPDIKIAPPANPSLPWDSDLHTIATGRTVISRDHLAGVPNWLVDSLIDLKPLPWSTVE